MVYCGKPSKGCDYCRKRRLKCDQARPGCGQCRNASRACPGYRNQLDLMFRDESTRVQQKYQVTSRRASDGDAGPEAEAEQARNCSGHESSLEADASVREHRSTIISTERSPTWMVRNRISSERPDPAMSQALADIAIAFFLTHYTAGSHFEYLPLLYSDSCVESLLISAVQAVSIASLSHETRNPQLMALARKRYSHSLVKTNKALQDPGACCQDGTLASVLLLAHFETLASEDTTGVSEVALVQSEARYSPSASWDRHVQGAVSLLTLRPNPTFDSPIEFRLYQHVDAMVRYSCIQRCIRVPLELSSWKIPLRGKRDQADPDRRFMVVIDDFTELRASVKEGSLTDPLEIIRRASAIDAHAAIVARSFPQSWAYDTVSTSQDKMGVYQNKYHLYPNHRAAQLWNEVRMTRLALNEILLDYSDNACQRNDRDADERGKPLFPLRARYLRVVEQMATEICQSTTQFLCRPRSGTSATLPIGIVSPSPKTPPASVYFLIWPLFTAAGASRVASKSLIAFAIDRLHFIQRAMNIPQARKAAIMLEQGILIEEWLHMLHLF
ncbi:hypothetical protein PV04_09444 [Phialophora macrospora]|uniref:Zn(2)-C6 fungal-type domain-containing protein n=1 Tax=Phialophora macrospora TaxID=1851006 RepID=A0A0D2CH71_9EURO|nr:hypothetical protein PV04_09444 [Phialophora macrospora]